MRQLVALTIACTLFSGCLTTNYVIGDEDDVDVRFGPRHKGETLVRHIEVDEWRNHFLLGLIPVHKDVDLAELADLEPGQRLVNTHVESTMSGWSLPVWLGLGVLTAGIGCAVWTPRVTTLTGDVVEVKGKAKQAKEGEAKEAEEAPKAEETGGRFVVLDGTFTQKDALAACAKQDATLARKVELEVARKEKRFEERAGDVWTSDTKGHDGWSFNTESGAAFLKNPEETLGAVCYFKKGT